MIGLIRRYKMNRLLKRFKHAYYNNDDLMNVCDLDNDMETIAALEQYDCIKVRRAMGGHVYFISLGDRSEIYSIERSELWFNRIVSYIAGIISAIIVPLLISLIKSL